MYHALCYAFEVDSDRKFRVGVARNGGSAVRDRRNRHYRNRIRESRVACAREGQTFLDRRGAARGGVLCSAGEVCARAIRTSVFYVAFWVFDFRYFGKEGIPIMKKLICTLLALTLLCGAALAETVYVTVSDDQGEFRLACAATEVSDVDGDGALTVYDALYCAHEQYYEGGAAGGFGAVDEGYGPSLTKLWGIDNGGSYGYYVGNNSCMNLAEPVEEGIHVQAYAYRDLENWSDAFTYFQEGEDGTLTLVMQGYDADWNVVETPLAGAKITLNSADTGLVTDENGRVTPEIPEAPGVYIISATYDDAVIVPPIYSLTVSAVE